MDFVSAFRVFCGKIDIIIAFFIEKIYGLIMDLAGITLKDELFSDMTNKVYMLIGLFMLFKLALSVISFVINPDNLFSKNSSFSKLLKKIVITLAMLTLFPAVFGVMKNIQTIVLKENIIARLFFDMEVTSSDMSNTGKEVAYYVFSSFIDYNRSGDLKVVFNSGCVNPFLYEDYNPSIEQYNVGYCEAFPILINTCTHFLTPYNFVSYEDYKGACEKVEMRYEGACLEYMMADSRLDNEVYHGYFACKKGKGLVKSGQEDEAIIKNYDTTIPYPTINCGIKNGLYIFQLINKARIERDISAMLDELVITAKESDPLFVGSYCPYDIDTGKENNVKDAGGDYVFEYKFFISSIVGIIVLVMFIILAVDVAVRTIKLTFLQIIAPVPIISNIDVKESKLFKSWLNLLISTYLELFIKLATIFFSLFIVVAALNGDAPSLKVLETRPMAKVLFIVGTFLFMFKVPKMLSELFNIKTEGSVLSVLKGAGKFILGAGSMAIAGVGGSVANLASGIEEKKGVGKTALSMIAGGNSAALRTLGNQIANKGNASLYNIQSGIRGSVTARADNAAGRNIGVRAMDQLRDITQINPRIKQDSKTLQTEIDRLNERLNSANLALNTALQSDSQADRVREAFRTDNQLNRIYDDYNNYHNATGSDLSQDKYDSYADFYEEQLDLKRQIRELEKRKQLEEENERIRTAHQNRNRNRN